MEKAVNESPKISSHGKFQALSLIGIFFILIAIFFLGVIESEDKKHFISQIHYIDNSIKESIVLSPTLELKIEDLPKTISIENKEYPIEYKKNYLLIRGFKNSNYCNKEFDSNRNDGVHVIGTMSLRTFCKDNDMQVVYKKLGQ